MNRYEADGCGPILVWMGLLVVMNLGLLYVAVKIVRYAWTH